EDGIRDKLVTGVQTCALPISCLRRDRAWEPENAHDRAEPCSMSGRWLSGPDLLTRRRRRSFLLYRAIRGPGESRIRRRRHRTYRSEERRVGKECRTAEWLEPL